jgi:membrane-bound serine protease (ClpP class)
MFAAVVLAFVTGRSLMRSSRFGKMVLQNTMESEAGYVSADAVLDTLIGAHGVTDTLLRPSGKVLIGARVYDAVADNSFIEKGVSITVKSLSGQSLVVTKKTDL